MSDRQDEYTSGSEEQQYDPYAEYTEMMRRGQNAGTDEYEEDSDVYIDYDERMYEEIEEGNLFEYPETDGVMEEYPDQEIREPGPGMKPRNNGGERPVPPQKKKQKKKNKQNKQNKQKRHGKGKKDEAVKKKGKGKNTAESKSGEKKKKGRKKRRTTRKFRRRVRLVIILLLMAAGFVLFLSSSIFTVSNITVQNNMMQSDREVIKQAGIKKEKNIFTYQERKIRAAIKEANPYISDVSVSRELPNRLIITVKENTPVASVRYGERYLILDKNGTVVGVEKTPLTTTRLMGVKVRSYKKGKQPIYKNKYAIKQGLNLIKKVNESGLFFKKLDVSSTLIVTGYITDKLKCTGSIEDIAANLEGIKAIVYDLGQKDTLYGTINVGSDGFATYSDDTTTFIADSEDGSSGSGLGSRTTENSDSSTGSSTTDSSGSDKESSTTDSSGSDKGSSTTGSSGSDKGSSTTGSSGSDKGSSATGSSGKSTGTTSN